MARTSFPRSRRPRNAARRSNPVTTKFSDPELAAVKDAAERAGLALGAWLGRTGVDAATGTAVPASRMQLDAVDALSNATEQVRMAGRLLNQAVARLNTSGAAGPELRRYADNVARTVRTLEDISITTARKIL